MKAAITESDEYMTYCRGSILAVYVEFYVRLFYCTAKINPDMTQLVICAAEA